MNTQKQQQTKVEEVEVELKECRDEDLNDHIQRIVTPELFEEEEDERYCDNDDCPYGGYIYDEELEKYKGKEYICIGCKTGKGLQERELEEEEEEKCEICDRNAYHKNDWHCSQGKEEKEEEE